MHDNNAPNSLRLQPVCFCGVRCLRFPQGAQVEITLGRDSILAWLRLESHRGASEMRMFFLGMMVAYTPSLIILAWALRDDLSTVSFPTLK
jgi:hypothetical protein